MNQGAWLHLEGYTAAAANDFERVWVTAGPIFDKGKAVGYVGEADKGEVPVAIPHALFKLIVRETDERRPDALAFVFEQAYTLRDRGVPKPSAQWVSCRNAAGSGERHVYRHRPRLVTLSALEARTGLSFFAGARDRLVVPPDELPAGLWEIEERYWSGSVCAGQRWLHEEDALVD